MTIDKVVERVSEGGNLLANLALIDISTWETSQQVWKAWQSGAPVQGVNTANMGIYRLVDGEPVFNLLGMQGNLFVDERFREDTYNGILRNEFFLPQAEMKDHVMAAIDTGLSVEIHYSGLKTKTTGCNESYCFVEAGRKNTDEEKKLFKGVYGVENPGNGRKIYLLRENVVKSALSERQDDLVARACYFDGDQFFFAVDSNFGYYVSAVRWVRRDVAGGDAQKVSEETKAVIAPSYDDSLKAVLATPIRNDTEATALLAHVTQFYQAKVLTKP